MTAMPTKSHSPSTSTWTPRPGDATLSVTKAAQVLGVHPNTVRAWSEAGRLRYYRINERGDRRYRLGDLQRFLATAESPVPSGATMAGLSRAARRGLASTLTETSAGLDLLADLAEVASFPTGLDPALDEACRRIRIATGAALVGIWERRPGGLVARAMDLEGPGAATALNVPPGRGLFARALESPQPIHARPGDPSAAPVLGIGTDELLVAIPGGEVPWGVLVIAGAMQLGPDDGRRLATAIARTLGVLVRGAGAAEQATSRLRRSEALRRVATDLASRLDVADVVRDLSDHARVLFGADRVAVILRDAEGRVSSPGGSGFSEAFLGAARELEHARTGLRELPSRRPVSLLGPAASRSPSPVRAAAIQDGVESLLLVPLVDGQNLHGVLYLAHDRPHRWREGDLDAAEALAGDAAVAVRSARTFSRMAAWAAQLQSIQRLGARLAGITDVHDIGNAIATELRQLITYDNARVYRVHDSELVPVAFQGHGTVYGAETPDALTVAVGEGITGWVAKFKVPQLVDDSARDARGVTIPGTDAELDESMLLAPMVHEGACLGVVVLVRQGLRQFTEDDLRLLVIYASFAAQAMANADATFLLREQSARAGAPAARPARAPAHHGIHPHHAGPARRPRADHGPPRVADPLRQHRHRGRRLPHGPAPAPDRPRRARRLLPRPLGARRDRESPRGWSSTTSPVLVEDERTDPRVNHFREMGAIEGSLIVVPLIGPKGAAGVLTLERLGRRPPSTSGSSSSSSCSRRRSPSRCAMPNPSRPPRSALGRTT